MLWQSGSRASLNQSDIRGSDAAANIYIFPEVGTGGCLPRLRFGLADVGSADRSIPICVAQEQTHRNGYSSRSLRRR